jgi:hypothetical protein
MNIQSVPPFLISVIGEHGELAEVSVRVPASVEFIVPLLLKLMRFKVGWLSASRPLPAPELAALFAQT